VFNLEEIIKSHHTASKSQKTIANLTGKSLSTIRRLMKKLGLSGRSKGARDYCINSTVFDKINTIEKAYWLGFLLADGCLAKSAGSYRAIRLSLQDRDSKHLKEFAKFIGYDGKLYVNLSKGHRRLSVVFNDVYLGKQLLKHGWLNYKQGVSSEILDMVPDDLFHSFVRGYFDGDGCISGQVRKQRKRKRWYANICCKFDKHLLELNTRIISTGGPEAKIKKRNKSYDIRYNNLSNVTHFYYYIYSGLGPKLDRKFNKFITAIGGSTIDWYNIHDFKIRAIDESTHGELLLRLLSDGWVNPKHDLDKDLSECRKVDLKNYIIEGEGIRTGLAPGNKIIQTLQPIIFRVKQNKKPCIADLSEHSKLVDRAVSAFLKEPSKLYPSRLVRELNFVGFTQASILSVPVIMAAIRVFNLNGTWFDPCAGWGSRMIAAYLLGLNYSGTDPGVCYGGLERLKKYLEVDFDISDKRYQDYNWVNSDFVFTSPPFYNKEDYLDDINYGSYDSWVAHFLLPLIDKSLKCSGRTVLHVDSAMLNSIKQNYKTIDIKLFSISRHKAPKEWFVEILNR
jgi:hypothetical protein